MLHTHSLPLKRPHDAECACRTCAKTRLLSQETASQETASASEAQNFYRPKKLPEVSAVETPLHPPVIVHLNHERDWHTRILLWLILLVLILIWGKAHGWAQSPVSSEVFYYNALTGKWTAVSSANPMPVTVSGGSTSNPCASATGSAVPSSACYSGLNISGDLAGWTGFGLTHANAAAVAIVDGNGNQITSFGGGTQYTQGTTQASPVGTVAMGLNPSNVLNALNQDASGNLLVNINANSFGTFTVQGSTNIFKVSPTTAANSASNPFFDQPSDGTSGMGTMANFGTAPGAVKALNANADIYQAGAAISSANPIFDTPTDSSGNTLAIDPCQRGAKTYKNFNLASSTAALLLTGVAGKHWYICSILIPEVAGAVNVAIIEGTTTTNPCDTTTIAVPGLTGGSGTAATGANLAANQGFAFGNGGYAIGETAVAADNVCILASSSNQVSGGLTAVDY